jgi:hypothetical protein
MYAHWKDKKWSSRYEKDLEPKDFIKTERLITQSLAPQQIPVPAKI